MFSQHPDLLKPDTTLTPEQAYLVAIGMFTAAGYTCQLVVTGRGKPFEYARVFVKNHIQHVLYFPGSDEVALKRLSINQITESANKVIAHTLLMPKERLAAFHKHYLVLDTRIQDHFVYSCAHDTTFYTVDTFHGGSKDYLPYDNYQLERLHPALPLRHRQYAASTRSGEIWKCGHGLLLALYQQLDFDEVNVVEVGQGDVAPLQLHNQFYVLGKQTVARRNEATLYREAVTPSATASQPIQPFRMRFATVAKALIKGVLIGLIIAAIVASVVYTFGGSAALLATVGAIGAMCGFAAGGASSVLFGLAIFAGFTATLSAVYSVIANYRLNKKFYISSLPADTQMANQTNRTSRVIKALHATTDTNDLSNEHDLPPPPSYSDCVASSYPDVLPVAGLSSEETASDDDAVIGNSPRRR